MKAAPVADDSIPITTIISSSTPLASNPTSLGAPKRKVSASSTSVLAAPLFLRWFTCALFFALALTTTTAMSTGHNEAAATTATATAIATSARSTIDFLTMARGLKTTPRTGWIRQKAGPRIESVADHSWRMSLMAMVATSSCNNSGGQMYDANRCIQIALVHDLAEATVGDITPHCGVSDATKHELELQAITSMTSQLRLGVEADNSNNNNTANDGESSSSMLPSTSQVGGQILELWKEYEAGETPEAKLVKDMDKLEMILQALEYEADGKNEDSLDGFFDSTRNKWRTPIGKAWGEEINKRRKEKTVRKNIIADNQAKSSDAQGQSNATP